MRHHRLWGPKDGSSALKWTLRDHYESVFNRYAHEDCYSEGERLTYNSYLLYQTNSFLSRQLTVNCDTLWLDLGCGQADTSLYYAKRGVRPYLLDPAPSAVRLARRQFLAHGCTARVLQGDGFALAFREKTFDVIGCIGVLENLPNSEQVVSEMSRVVKVGGVCFASIQIYTRMTVQSLVLPLAYLKGLLTRGVGGAHQYLQGYRECPHPVNAATPERYVQMFTTAGFRHVKVWNLNFFPALPLHGYVESLYVRLIGLVLKVRGAIGIAEPFATSTGFGKTLLIVSTK